jgi:hypothetical protein
MIIEVKTQFQDSPEIVDPWFHILSFVILSLSILEHFQSFDIGQGSFWKRIHPLTDGHGQTKQVQWYVPC